MRTVNNMTLVLVVVLVVGVFAFGANPPNDSTKDQITGLPIYPGLADSDPLPKSTICKSQMQGDFYIVVGKKADAVTDWYAKHLPGFKKYHSITDGRSQDTFFNADGTQEVTITGGRNNPEVYSVSYNRFQPGVSPATMASFNTGKLMCH